MGPLGYFFGSLYDDVTKKKKKAPEPVVDLPKDPPAGAKTKPKQTQEEPVVVQQRPSAEPVYPSTTVETTPRKMYTPEELLDAAEAMKIFADRSEGQFPTFDISDLQSKIQDYNTSDLPLDLRGLAGLADNIYGTKMYAATPNIRAERLDELQKIKALNSDSQALQQVKGQARLAEFKTKLKSWEDSNGIMSPLDRAKALKEVRDALGGSRGEDLAAQRFAYSQSKDIAEADRQVQKENRERDAKYKTDVASQTASWKKENEIFKGHVGRTKQLRSILADKGNGTADYSTTILFVKMLEPLSAVMFNEANSFNQSSGVVSQIMNLKERILFAKKITPEQNQAMLDLLAKFEVALDEDYAAMRRGKEMELATVGIEPKDVLGPVDAWAKADRGEWDYRMPDGKKSTVKAKDLHLFLRETRGKATPLGKR